MDSLLEIFNHYGSDKGSILEGHMYSIGYEELIDKNIENLLEIGIGTDYTYNGTCGSIRAWLQWLPNTNIYGFDIQDAPDDLKNNPRFKCILGDQSKEADLINLKNSIPDCDIIIDDGSHINSHQIATFNILWDKVKPGGYYIIEDVHCKWGNPPYTTDVLSNHPNLHKYIGRKNEGMVFKKPAKFNFASFYNLPDNDFTQKLALNYEIFKDIYKVCGDKWSVGCGSYLFDGSNYTYYPKMYNKQKLLFDLAKNATNVLEVGTYMGHSALIMLLANPNLNIVSIDIDDTYAAPSLNLLREKFPNANIKFIYDDSLSALKNLNGKFDLFHIDGHHEQSLIEKEFNECKKLNDGNIMNIIFDDFVWFKALELKLCSEHEILSKITPESDWSNTYLQIKL